MPAKKPLYSIGIVAEILSLHPQTIRKYERLGFLRPERSGGNTRLYCDEDLERLRLVIKLTQELGINHAGVEIIMQMQEQIISLETTLEKLNSRVQELLSPPQTTGAIRIKVIKE